MKATADLSTTTMFNTEISSEIKKCDRTTKSKTLIRLDSPHQSQLFISGTNFYQIRSFSYFGPRYPSRQIAAMKPQLN